MGDWDIRLWSSGDGGKWSDLGSSLATRLANVLDEEKRRIKDVFYVLLYLQFFVFLNLVSQRRSDRCLLLNK